MSGPQMRRQGSRTGLAMVRLEGRTGARTLEAQTMKLSVPVVSTEMTQVKSQRFAQVRYRKAC